MDNLAKAKGFAKYAEENIGIGRIQLIRMSRDTIGHNRFKRLDMSKGSVRYKVFKAVNTDELDQIFDTDGFLCRAMMRKLKNQAALIGTTRPSPTCT